ncbi:hypothetical protein BGZ67_007576 [Mortierella alpina]|nr:hypothetical protein BGZ67_007576 [Mortierella alpina]
MPADSSTLTHMHSHTEPSGASARTLPLIPSPTSLCELSHLVLDSCLSPLPEAEGELTDQDRHRLCEALANLRETSTQAQQAYLAVHASIQQYQQLVLSTHAQVAAAKHSLMQARGIITSPSATTATTTTTSSSSSFTSSSTSSTSLISAASSSNISSNASTPPLSPISPISPIERHPYSLSTTKDVRDHPPTGYHQNPDLLNPNSTQCPHPPLHPPPAHHHHHHHYATDAANRGTSEPRKEATTTMMMMTTTTEPEPPQEREQDPETKEMRLAKLKQQHAELGGRLSQLLRDKAAAEETKKRLNDGLLRTKARMKEIERRLGKVI